MSLKHTPENFAKLKSAVITYVNAVQNDLALKKDFLEKFCKTSNPQLIDKVDELSERLTKHANNLTNEDYSEEIKQENTNVVDSVKQFNEEFNEYIESLDEFNQEDSELRIEYEVLKKQLDVLKKHLEESEAFKLRKELIKENPSSTSLQSMMLGAVKKFIKTTIKYANERKDYIYAEFLEELKDSVDEYPEIWKDFDFSVAMETIPCLKELPNAAGWETDPSSVFHYYGTEYFSAEESEVITDKDKHTYLRFKAIQLAHNTEAFSLIHRIFMGSLDLEEANECLNLVKIDTFLKLPMHLRDVVSEHNNLPLSKHQMASFLTSQATITRMVTDYFETIIDSRKNKSLQYDWLNLATKKVDFSISNTLEEDPETAIKQAIADGDLTDMLVVKNGKIDAETLKNLPDEVKEALMEIANKLSGTDKPTLH